jgi:hypothetical protein
MEATSELAKTWTWVRGPSPPEVPWDATVSFALTSSLICRGNE